MNYLEFLLRCVGDYVRRAIDEATSPLSIAYIITEAFDIAEGIIAALIVGVLWNAI